MDELVHGREGRGASYIKAGKGEGRIMHRGRESQGGLPESHGNLMAMARRVSSCIGAEKGRDVWLAGDSGVRSHRR